MCRKIILKQQYLVLFFSSNKTPEQWKKLSYVVGEINTMAIVLGTYNILI